MSKSRINTKKLRQYFSSKTYQYYNPNKYIDEFFDLKDGQKKNIKAFKAFFILSFNLFLKNKEDQFYINIKIVERVLSSKNHCRSFLDLEFYNPPLVLSYYSDLIENRDYDFLIKAINKFLDRHADTT
jgi:hypothetical protein